MCRENDIKEQMLEMMKLLNTKQLAELNETLRDALLSAARGEPSRYAINELVHISQHEARRICQEQYQVPDEVRRRNNHRMRKARKEKQVERRYNRRHKND